MVYIIDNYYCQDAARYIMQYTAFGNTFYLSRILCGILSNSQARKRPCLVIIILFLQNII